jgi:hypothetical protein
LNKLAIVGSGKNTRENAPFDDPSFDIWVFNEAANSEWCKRWTACFQMHEPEIYKGVNTKDPQHWQWLQRRHGKPIYMQEIDAQVPDSVRFPLDEAKELAGVQMFPTTFAYMAALAILQGYEEIRIFGVELSASEYEYQANGYLFWFGFLRGKLGADKVDSAVLYLDKNIFNVPLYGYEGNYALGKDHFAQRAALLDAQWQSAEKHAVNMMKSIERAIENDINKIPDLVREYQTAVQTCGEYAGALSEAERYMQFGDRYADRGGFEFAGASAQQKGEESRIAMYGKVGLIEYLWNVYKQTNNPQAANQLMQQIQQYGKLAEETGALLGVYRENISYIVRYDEAMKANGNAS